MATGADEARFRDPGTYVYGYLDEILVRCPRCGGCATVTALRGPKTSTSESVGLWSAAGFRLLCSACGHAAKRGRSSSWNLSRPQPPTDPAFGLALWLQTPCRGRTLWAFNARHLCDLAAFVAATHRVSGRDAEGGMSSRTMIASLPRWLILAKNRDDVLRGVERLRERLATC